MMVPAVFSLIFLFQQQLSSSLVIQDKINHEDDVIACANDLDCGNEQYCSIETNYCEKCIPCTERFNRQPASNNQSCAKSEQDCGDCLPGFEANPLANERNFSTKCYLPFDKLVSLTNPTKSESPSMSQMLIASAMLVVTVALGLLVYFSKNIRKFLRPLAQNPDNMEMGSVGTRPKPSAPCADSDSEDQREERIHLMRNPPPESIIQVERPCGAVPIGPHHENISVHFVPENGSSRDNEDSNTDATQTVAPSSMESSNPDSTNVTPRETPRLASGVERVRPPVFRSISDSGLVNLHVRRPSQRPTITQAIDSLDESSQANENVVEVGMAFTIKRNKNSDY